jgi:ubiquinone/menaquinone biosynthesis C-methylase UbiE
MKPPSLLEYYHSLQASLELQLLHTLRALLCEQGGLLPECVRLVADGRVLDVACGRGQWVQAMARHYPAMEALGRDAAPEAIRAARLGAMRLSNARFAVGDLCALTDCAEQSFDLVRACFIAPLVAPQSWPALLKECVRVCRPGGTILWVEWAFPETNSMACSHCMEMLRQAIQYAGKTPDITPMMDLLLREASAQPVHKLETMLNISTGTDIHTRFCRHISIALALIQPFLTNKQVGSSGEIDSACREAIMDIYQDEFLATWAIHTVVAEKARAVM